MVPRHNCWKKIMVRGIGAVRNVGWVKFLISEILSEKYLGWVTFWMWEILVGRNFVRERFGWKISWMRKILGERTVEWNKNLDEINALMSWLHCFTHEYLLNFSYCVAVWLNLASADCSQMRGYFPRHLVQLKSLSHYFEWPLFLPGFPIKLGIPGSWLIMSW